MSIDILPADLTRADEIAAVEARLRDDDRIGILLNNAGAGLNGSFVDQPTDAITQLIAHPVGCY
ncbi:hypothetical protein [Novosphingobium sp. P6W]|uniref:hypothetical protein n=1 Tax=Novosphingobium sp. P6W TaxID=1609758 RepID=UPI000696DABE|nr:hypothetical protein [Novosphingobium sp. P6W]